MRNKKQYEENIRFLNATSNEVTLLVHSIMTEAGGCTPEAPHVAWTQISNRIDRIKTLAATGSRRQLEHEAKGKTRESDTAAADVGRGNGVPAGAVQ